MTSDTAFTATMTAKDGSGSATYTGAFSAACDTFRFWNWNNHEDGENSSKHNIYVNNPKVVETTSAPGGTVSDTVTIIVAEEGKPAPTITVGAIPSDAEVGKIVNVYVTASGEGNPTIAMTSTTRDGQKYSGGVSYSAGTGLLSFTPAAAGEYKFDFLATNTSSDGKTTNATVKVTVKDNAPTIEVNAVADISIGADGKLHVELGTSSEVALSGVPVYGATGFDAATGDWNWLDDPVGYVNIDKNGNTTFDLSITADSLIISVGKPTYLK